MKAVQVVRHGSPRDAVAVCDVPTPDAFAGMVRVAVSTASLNFGDIARCRGGVASVVAQPPFTLSPRWRCTAAHTSGPARRCSSSAGRAASARPRSSSASPPAPT